MQKKIIALAVAGLVSGAAFAQSNVTIYGIADAAYLYGKGDTPNGSAKFSGIQSGAWSGSRVGFKGEEALGNGLKAIFQIEFGTDIDSNVGGGGAGFNLNRQTFVGLDTNFGTVSIGKQYAPSWLYMGRNSANEITGNNPSNQFQSSNGPIANAGGTMTTNSAARWNNSIAFQSKNYSGLSTRVMYAFGETANGVVTTATPVTADTTDNGKFGISANYMNGPLNVDLIYQTQINVRSIYPYATPDLQGNDINEWYIGAGFDFKVVKLVGSFQQLRNKNDVRTQLEPTVWTAGLIVPVGAAGKIRAEYGHVQLDQDAGVTDGTSNGYSLGYTHDLSKRTMLYTSVARIKNDSNSQGYGLGASITNINANTGFAGESNWSFLAGVRHLF